jgi:hypothetical protein
MSLNQILASKEKKEPIQDLFLQAIKNPEQYSDKLVARLNSMKEQWVNERDKVNQRVWRNNLQFYSGNHYIRDTYNGGNSYRVRLRENHINNVMARLLSIIVQNLPIIRVFPETDQACDATNADNTEAYLKYFWRTKKLQKILQRYVKQTLIFGNAFLYHTWNPDLGDEVLLDAFESDSGKAEIQTYEGDIEVAVDDPFKVAVRPGIDDWEDHYDVIRSVTASRAMIESKYGPIEAESAVVYSSYLNETRVDDDSVVINHYWHKPTPWFPSGMYASWCGKKILKMRCATKSEKTLPLIHLGFDKVPLKFWALSSIEQVIDLQEQLNRAASMITEARNLMARPRVLASNESKVPAQSLSDRPGEIIRFAAAGGEPKFITPNFNFSELAANKNDLRNAISMVTGITSASRGEIPNATRTALALQLVLEQDRSQYLPFINDFHQTILDLGYGILGEAAENIDESDPRTIKIEGRTMGARTFHGGMVPSPLDLHLEDTNPLGWTAAGRIEQIQSLAQMGVLKDRNQILEMLKINSSDPAYDLANINRNTQQKENQLLEKGEIVPIESADIDEIHLDEIDKVMASFEYKFKPKPVKDAYEKHKADHENRIAMKAGAQTGQAPVRDEDQVAADPLAKALDKTTGIYSGQGPGELMEKLLGSNRSGA